MKISAYIAILFTLSLSFETEINKVLEQSFQSVQEMCCCCSDLEDADDSNCSHESSAGDCSDSCECIMDYQPSSSYTASIAPASACFRVSIEIKDQYKSIYSFYMPNIIWHPPQVA